MTESTDHFLLLYQRELDQLDGLDAKDLRRDYGSARNVQNAIADARTLLMGKIEARKREIGVIPAA